MLLLIIPLFVHFSFSSSKFSVTYELRHGKTNKMAVCPAKPQISLDIRPVWSESSLSAWRKLGSLATHWVHSDDSYQTEQMPRLIWVFAGRTVTLLVLSSHGSYFLASMRAKVFKFCIHIESGQVYCGTENKTEIYSAFFFLSFTPM